MSRPVGSKGRAPKRPNGAGTITKQGYVRVMIGGKIVMQHRHLLEQHLGRKLSRSEDAHHDNQIKRDNRIENLEPVDHAEHSRMHARAMWARRTPA